MITRNFGDASGEEFEYAARMFEAGKTGLRTMLLEYAAYRATAGDDVNPMVMPANIANIISTLDADELRLIVTVTMSQFYATYQTIEALRGLLKATGVDLEAVPE